jgi:hypothetical protein
MGKEIDVEDCPRYRVKYRDQNLYVVVSENRLDISLTNLGDVVEFRTTAGIALVERLINELLDRGMPIKEVATACLECSYQKGDLPGILGERLSDDII